MFTLINRNATTVNLILNHYIVVIADAVKGEGAEGDMTYLAIQNKGCIVLGNCTLIIGLVGIVKVKLKFARPQVAPCKSLGSL